MPPCGFEQDGEWKVIVTPVLSQPSNRENQELALSKGSPSAGNMQRFCFSTFYTVCIGKKYINNKLLMKKIDTKESKSKNSMDTLRK